MAIRLVRRALSVGALCLAVMPSLEARADGSLGDNPPYKMVRSLQNIQDQVIAGDLKALDMQRFLLAEIDRRLREVDMSVFEDTRNVDAALIYAMSGGNPDVLDVLANKDIQGNFDNRVTAVLRRYLAGKGATAAKQLKEVVPEYRNEAIGPYIALIGANALMEKETDVALKYFDWARVAAPGTIVEEAALRRSLAITAKKGEIKKSLDYATRYARRFMTSPYASQFADIFVSIATDSKSKLTHDDIRAILSMIERRRQREIYLRLARRSAIDGNKPLADFAAEEARGLSLPEDKEQLALAELYSGLVNLSGGNINNVLDRLSKIPDADLSAKDRFLREAAKVVADEVLQPPDQASLTQVRRTMVDKEYRDMMSQKIIDAGKTASISPNTPPKGADPGALAEEKPEPNREALDQRLQAAEGFVSAGRSKLKEIDALLSDEGGGK
ncbi:chemotaxis protein MotC [Rhizobium alvei]|uniref:Chemotaxis protein MotC n=1 Tax=Rhizobium alvei TaxID=1132659 RepID=A0ABT8YGW3_9HYPH|nr:chemotaxis protein MotC [Rhizobium alvei]MDO6962573.1 chemotaxis protein MotC [Rhizobium alvei]